MTEKSSGKSEVEEASFDFAEDYGLDVSCEKHDAGCTQYDDKNTVKDYATSFNLLKQDDRPDSRNILYKSSTAHLECPICQQPFIRPLTTICGHTFCEECIIECFKMSKENSRYRSEHNNASEPLKGCCPLDRTPLDSSNINDLFPTPLLITNLIDDLRVFCLNHERGCTWTGCRWELENHVLSDCGFTGVYCHGIRYNNFVKNEEKGTEVENKPSEECKLIVERRFITSDSNSQDDVSKTEKDECIHKLYQCQFCNFKVTKITERHHLDQDCLFNYQTCDLCSNDMILQRNLEKHKENCTRTGKLMCPAESIGCQWVGNNKTALEIHLQRNNCQLNHFLPHWNDVNQKLKSLESENATLQKQINKILDSIIQGKVTNLGYSEPIEEINRFTSGWRDSDAKLSNSSLHDKFVYVSYELERLKYELDQKVVPFIDRENTSGSDRQNILNGLVNDNFMMKDELNLQRVVVNSLRKQLQFLLFKNRNQTLMPGAQGFGNGLAVPDNVTGISSEIESLHDGFDLPSRNSSEERLNLKL